MKKRLLTTILSVLCMIGMSAQTRYWTDPDANYQQQTVVYAKLDVGDYSFGNYLPRIEMAAFIDGELRDAVIKNDANDYISGTSAENSAYVFRVGGVTGEEGKTITFKLYDPQTGIVYPLTSSAEVTYQGESTTSEPSNAITLSCSNYGHVGKY